MSKVTTTNPMNNVTNYCMDKYTISILHIGGMVAAWGFLHHEEYTDEFGSATLYATETEALAHLAKDFHNRFTAWEFEELAELLTQLY